VGNGIASRAAVVIPFLRGEHRTSHQADLADRRRDLAHLFKEHHARLVSFLALRLGSEGEAQEVAQEAYVRLLQPEQLAHTDNLRALLYVTSRNIAIDRLRRLGRKVSYEREQAWREADVPTPERIVSDRQQLERVCKLIEDLPPKCQYAFISYKFHDMSYVEIAYKMGVTESMVRKYVLRAVAYCASSLDQEGAQ
jgi:RNA polymerase sigma factor (sigma-70 family)